MRAAADAFNAERYLNLLTAVCRSAGVRTPDGVEG